MSFFESRYKALLQAHDTASASAGDSLQRRHLPKIVSDLHQVVRRAARTNPRSKQDVALLLHMAIMDLGIDPEGNQPGHEALRAALGYLEKPKGRKISKTETSRLTHSTI